MEFPGMVRGETRKQIDGISEHLKIPRSKSCSRPTCRIYGQTDDATIRWYDTGSHAKDDSLIRRF